MLANIDSMYCVTTDINKYLVWYHWWHQRKNKYYVPRRDVSDNLCANENTVLV